MVNGKTLKKAGISITRQLSALEVNKIASIISDKICNAFSEHCLVQSDLFVALSRVDMYLAEFKDCSAAKYDYRNNCIYFKDGMNFDEIEIPAIHECLHFIQAIRNDHGKLQRLGLYEVNKIKDNGMIINEAAVQLMATEAVKGEDQRFSGSQSSQRRGDSVKYYGLEFNAESPNYYPIECSLVRQMAYFTGTYPLYHSAIYSDDIFKNTFIMKSSKETYNQICKNLDNLVKLQENVHVEISYLQQIEDKKSNEKSVLRSQEVLQGLKDKIKSLALETQNLILTSCSYSDLDLVRNNQDVRDFKDKLYKFQKYLIISDEYNFYNEFYVQMMEQLDKKRELIEKYGSLEVFNEIPENLSLLETRQAKLNLFQLAKQKLAELFRLNAQEKTEKGNVNNK